MTETEIDAILAHLVPEFELIKLAAIQAQDDYLTLTACCGESNEAAAAHRRWQRLETDCQSILQQIEALAECSAV